MDSLCSGLKFHCPIVPTISCLHCPVVCVCVCVKFTEQRQTLVYVFAYEICLVNYICAYCLITVDKLISAMNFMLFKNANTFYLKAELYLISAMKDPAIARIFAMLAKTQRSTTV